MAAAQQFLPLPGPHRFHAIAELTGNPVHVPYSVPNSARKVRTIRTAAAFSSGLYLGVVGLPGDCSFGMTPSSFPRPGASRISKAIQQN